MTAVIALERLSKMFGDIRAVGPIDLQVREGEFLSLLGPSGCGKTTTLRMIAGLEEPTRGTIRIRGHVVNDVPVERRGVGMVFQSYALFPHLSVFENVAFGLRLRRLPADDIRARVARALGLVGLAEMGQRMPAHLSGGQQQRVALARALVIEPAVLLLDEPLSNLDLKLREQMRDEIRRLQKALGVTAVYVTHDQGEALAMSDRIAVMNDGLIEQVGAPREIYEEPRTLFVAGFIGQCNFLPVTLHDAGGNGPRVATPGGAVFMVPATRVSPGWEAGRTLTLVIRPEAILPAGDATPESAANRFTARVEGFTYLGEEIRLALRLAGSGEPLMMSVRAQRGLTPPRSGDTIAISVPPGECALLERRG